MGDNEGERKGNLIEPEEKAVLRREFEARQSEIPIDLKGGSLRSHKMPQYLIRFDSYLAIKEFEEIRTDGSVFHHKP